MNERPISSHEELPRAALHIAKKSIAAEKVADTANVQERRSL